VAPPWGRLSPSVARPLSPSEAADVKATALGLPESWCVQVLPPHGQLAITPLGERERATLCWVASRSLGRITREPWRPAR